MRLYVLPWKNKDALNYCIKDFYFFKDVLCLDIKRLFCILQFQYTTDASILEHIMDAVQ